MKCTFFDSIRFVFQERRSLLDFSETEVFVRIRYIRYCLINSLAGYIYSLGPWCKKSRRTTLTVFGGVVGAP